MKFRLFLFVMMFSLTALAQVAVAPSYDTGIFPHKNFVKNYGAEKNDANVTDASSIHSRSTSSPLAGAASHLINASAGSQVIKFTSSNFDSALAGGNCQAQFYYAETAGTAHTYYTAYVENSSASKISQTYTMEPMTSGSKKMVMFFPCPSSDYVNIVVAGSGDGADLKVDEIYAGQCFDCVTGSVTTEWKDFPSVAAGTLLTAETTNPTYGVTVGTNKARYRQNGSNWEIEWDHAWSGGGGTAGSGIYYVNLPSGVEIDTAYYDANTNTNVSDYANVNSSVGFFQASSHAGYSFIGSLTVHSSTKFKLNAQYTGVSQGAQYINSASSWIGNTYGFITVRAKFKGKGLSASTSAIKIENSNFGWTDGGAITVTGTTSNPTKGTVSIDKVWYKRVGDSLNVRYEYRQTAAGAAGSGDYLFLIPNGLSIDTTKITAFTTVTGWGAVNTISNSVGSANFSSPTYTTVGVGNVVVYDATRVRIAGTDKSANGFISSSGYGFDVAALSITADFTVPISGWSESLPAPLLVGSVTSSASGAMRVEAAQIANNGTATITEQHGSWLSSVSRTGAGNVTLTFATGYFSATPTCVCTAKQNNGVAAYLCSRSSAVTPSSTAYAFEVVNGSIVPADRDFEVMCLGPR
jgi:hypothetical protein